MEKESNLQIGDVVYKTMNDLRKRRYFCKTERTVEIDFTLMIRNHEYPQFVLCVQLVIFSSRQYMMLLFAAVIRDAGFVK